MRVFIAAVFMLLIFIPSAFARTITVTWTAPADDAGLPSEKAVTAYRLVYSTAPITEANFSTATQLSTGTPKAKGVKETYTYDLADGISYYFAIKSVDASGNWSALSNVIFMDFLIPTAIVDLSVK